MVRLAALSLSVMLLSPAAPPAWSAEAGFAQDIFAWLFGGPDGGTLDRKAPRPMVWTLHPSDRGRHPEARRAGRRSPASPAPLQGKYFVYDGGPSRGMSLGVTTPRGAIVWQGRPKLARAIRHGRVGTHVRRSLH